MQASRLIISDETRKKLMSDYPLSEERKRRIRIEGIKALIRSKPAGHKFKLSELLAAAGYRVGNSGKSIVDRDPSERRAYWAGQAFLSTVIRKRIIVKNSPNSFKSSYSIPEDAVEVKKPEIVEKTVEQLETPTESVFNSTEDSVKYTIEFKITKKNGIDYGKTAVASLDLHDTTLDKAEHMIIQTIKAVR